MQSRADPVRRIRRHIRATWLFGGLALGLSALWAFGPLGETRAAEGSGSALPQGEQGAATLVEDALDWQAFDVELWNTPSAPQAETPGASALGQPSRPFRLRLVGITKEEGELFAALYDPEQDQLFIVKNGARVSRYQVTKLTLAGVTLSDGRGSRELLIQEPRR